MTECAACAFARAEGWWGDTVPTHFTHCRDCHRTFSGKNFHCVRCHATFNSISAANLHRTSNGEVNPCKDPAGVGLVSRTDRPGGLVWAGSGEKFEGLNHSRDTVNQRLDG